MNSIIEIANTVNALISSFKEFYKDSPWIIITTVVLLLFLVLGEFLSRMYFGSQKEKRVKKSIKTFPKTPVCNTNKQYNKPQIDNSVNSRYKDFCLFSSPVIFKDYWRKKTFSIVRVYNLSASNDDVELCGNFEWQRKNIISTNHSFDPNMEVWGYKEYSMLGDKCLDILVKE